MNVYECRGGRLRCDAASAVISSCEGYCRAASESITPGRKAESIRPATVDEHAVHMNIHSWAEHAAILYLSCKWSVVVSCTAGNLVISLAASTLELVRLAVNSVSRNLWRLITTTSST